MSRQLIRFIIAGGLNTLVTAALFYLLSPLLGYLLAYSVVYVFGIAFAYALNTFFVFEVSKSWRSATFYPLIYVVMYLYGLLMMIIIVDHFNLSEMLALALVVLSSVPITFFLTRWFFAFFSRKQP